MYKLLSAWIYLIILAFFFILFTDYFPSGKTQLLNQLHEIYIGVVEGVK